MSKIPETPKEYIEAFDLMYKASLNARGAYDALEVSGASMFLPGFDHCKDSLNDAIEKAEKAKTKFTCRQ